jgi:hypothetical protein
MHKMIYLSELDDVLRMRQSPWLQTCLEKAAFREAILAVYLSRTGCVPEVRAVYLRFSGCVSELYELFIYFLNQTCEQLNH